MPMSFSARSLRCPSAKRAASRSRCAIIAATQRLKRTVSRLRMVGRDPAFYERLFDVCTELMETIHRVPQPVVAKVHGVATAAG